MKPASYLGKKERKKEIEQRKKERKEDIYKEGKKDFVKGRALTI
jgi:hypothetical protein